MRQDCPLLGQMCWRHLCSYVPAPTSTLPGHSAVPHDGETTGPDPVSALPTSLADRHTVHPRAGASAGDHGRTKTTAIQKKR